MLMYVLMQFCISTYVYVWDVGVHLSAAKFVSSHILTRRMCTVAQALVLYNRPGHKGEAFTVLHVFKDEFVQ